MNNHNSLVKTIAEHVLYSTEAYDDFLENTHLTEEQMKVFSDSHGHIGIEPDVEVILQLNPNHIYAQARHLLASTGTANHSVSLVLQ